MGFGELEGVFQTSNHSIFNPPARKILDPVENFELFRMFYKEGKAIALALNMFGFGLMLMWVNSKMVVYHSI